MTELENHSLSHPPKQHYWIQNIKLYFQKVHHILSPLIKMTCKVILQSYQTLQPTTVWMITGELYFCPYAHKHPVSKGLTPACRESTFEREREKNGKVGKKKRKRREKRVGGREEEKSTYPLISLPLTTLREFSDVGWSETSLWASQNCFHIYFSVSM